MACDRGRVSALRRSTHPGRVRERIAEFQANWLAHLRDLIVAAQAAGDIDDDEDADQLAFELNALLAQGNSTFVMFADPRALNSAHAGIRRRLALAAPSTDHPVPVAGKARRTTAKDAATGRRRRSPA
jgi:hypothetical protein